MPPNRCRTRTANRRRTDRTDAVPALRQPMSRTAAIRRALTRNRVGIRYNCANVLRARRHSETARCKTRRPHDFPTPRLEASLATRFPSPPADSLARRLHRGDARDREPGASAAHHRNRRRRGHRDPDRGRALRERARRPVGAELASSAPISREAGSSAWSTMPGSRRARIAARTSAAPTSAPAAPMRSSSGRRARWPTAASTCASRWSMR